MLNSSVSMRLGSLAEDTLMFAEGIGSDRSPRGRRGRKRSKKGSDILDGVVLNDEEDFVVVECTKPPLDEWEGEEGEEEESSQESDGEMVFLTKNDIQSPGVGTSGATTTTGGILPTATADGVTLGHDELRGAASGDRIATDGSGGEEITVGTEAWRQLPGAGRDGALEEEDRSFDLDEFQRTL